MNTPLKEFTLLGSTLLSIIATANGAMAQPVQENGSADNDDIIVTAQKREQNINDVPLSITAISGEAMVRNGITDAASLTKVTPGLSYVESGNSVPVYSLRGVGFFDTSIGAKPTVTVYLDEAPLPFSIMAQSAAFDVERVEVLKGPQGTLFGSNATGGAINYIAAKPTFDFNGGLTASYGRFNTADIQGYVTGGLADGLKLRIAARSLHSGPVQESYTRDDSLGRQSFTQGRILVSYDKISSLRVTLALNAFHDGGETQVGQFRTVVPVLASALPNIPLLVNYPIAPENNRAADWNAGAPLRKDNSFYNGSVRTEVDLSASTTLTSLTSYSYEKVNQTVDIDGTSLSNALGHFTGKVSSFSEELRLSGKKGGLQWMVGGNYSKDKSNETDIYTFNYTTSNATFGPGTLLDSIAPFGKQSFDNLAAFANGDLELGDHFVLHAGARYTRSDLDYEACLRAGDQVSANGMTGFYNRLRASASLSPIAPLQIGQCSSLNGLDPGPLAGKLNEDNFSWRGGIDFKPSQDVLLYFNISRGYKGGSIPVTAGFSNRTYKPVTQESVLAIEGGLKAELLDRRIILTGAAFYYDYTDKQVLGRVVDTPNILGALQALINVPKSRIAGAEGQITVRPAKGLSVSFAGTYLDSKVKGSFLNYDILGRKRDFGGNVFPYTPKWQAVVSGDYERPVSADLKGTAGFNYNYRSSTNAGFGGDSLLAIDNYGLLDLRAGIAARDDRWSVQIFGRNVTNKYYWTNVAKFFDVVRRLTGQPATYGVQASIRF